jgi:hypothetical protein
MADSRIFHRAAGDSERVAALSDLEYRVWTQYLLSADDFGVMPASAFVLQADNRALRQRPTKVVQKALEAVIASGLVLAFVHQGERYIWQPDWQDRQGIRYPRSSVRPLPSDLRAATVKTRKLFGEVSEISPQDSGEVSESSPHPVYAGGRETLTQTPTQTLTPEPAVKSSAMGGSHTLIDGRAQRRHGQHARCYEARGLCITPWVWDELLGRLGGDEATRRPRLKAWADAKVQATGTAPIGDRPDDWWRKQFARDHGVEAMPAPASRGAQSMASAERLAEQLANGAELDPFGTKALARSRAAAALVPAGRAS